MNSDTVALLQDMYRLARVQATLGKQDMSLDLDWAKLRLRIEKVLVREGLEIPERIEVSEEEDVDGA